MKTDKHRLTLDVDTSKIEPLVRLLERLQDAADRLERLAADPPANVEIVRLPDLERFEIEITTSYVRPARA